MAQSPMISVPLKATNEVDWETPLKAYIRDTYGDDPERYADECATLHRLRQDVRGAGKDSVTGRDLLYRYYIQLEFLDIRFPVDEQHIKIAFTWFDAFTHKPTTQFSLAFEKASVIFNISAVLSCRAASQARSAEAGLKTAYHSFQAAAGMFTYINENFLHAPSVDLNRTTVKTLIHIMLAQSQEIFLERQVADQKKAGLLAKLACQAAAFYDQALEGVQDCVTKSVFDKVWLLQVQIKANFMASAAQYYQALADNDANNHGVAIARLHVADSLAKEASRSASTFPSSVAPASNLSADCGPILVTICKRHLAAVQDKLREFIKDNDFLYHFPVPAETTLSPVPKLQAAKPLPVTELYAGQDIQRIAGPDLFSRIVPIAVTEAASLYDEEKAKLVRAETERVDLANGELAASLDYLRLPSALPIMRGSFDHNSPPDDDFGTWCEDVAGHENPVVILDRLQADRDLIVAVLDRSAKQIDMEESVCERMRSKYGRDWTQQPSGRLTTTLRGDLRRYREALDEVGRTDAQLAARLRQHETDLNEMRYAFENDSVDDLFRRSLLKLQSNKSSSPSTTSGPTAGAGSPTGPSLLDEDFDEDNYTVADQLDHVEEILKKLSLLKKERSQVLKDLKARVLTDDISQTLVLNKKAIPNFEAQLFQQELEKFRPMQNRLLQANHKQLSMMKEITAIFNTLLPNRRVRKELEKYELLHRHRTSTMNRYKKVYQDFLDLYSGLQGAKQWYSEMNETVQSLDKNVETFVNNRRSEGAQLLNQIEKEHEAAASAEAAAAAKQRQVELERERVRELMERMNMDRPSAAAATQAPPHMLSQQALAYNPSHFLPNSGPRSPPPTQSAFNTSGIPPTSLTQVSYGNRGVSTPPLPRQGSISYSVHPQHQSMPPYAPAGQQALFAGQSPNSRTSGSGGGGGSGIGVPSGFVMPPPPPGPPPLWPQQTVNYDRSARASLPPTAHTTAATAHAAEVPATYNKLSAENPAVLAQRGFTGAVDPWAGLNAWQ